MKTAHLIFGNQLFEAHPALAADPDQPIIMIEAHDVSARLPYHKHKLVLMIAAMRNYRDLLLSRGRQVIYVEMNPKVAFLPDLKEILARNKITRLEWMETSDLAPQRTLIDLCATLKLSYFVHQNLHFITPPDDFDRWYSSQRSPLMESFYRWQRKRTCILMEAAEPVQGEWNFDKENRKSLPKSLEVPRIIQVTDDANTRAAKELVEAHFPKNPGTVDNFWLPTDQISATSWLEDFARRRLAQFGPYEDASRAGELFLFHSVLSPLLNIGLLTVERVVQTATDAYASGSAPIASVEGFIRQIIGWREYMYGLYVRTPQLKDANYFGFTKQLESWWYDRSFEQQPLPIPLVSALETVHTYGYNHHIERLMILGNWFLLNEYDPRSVYRWFSSLYVDAYEWVMVPNVLGMSQYADGGVVATKPYISGGNYLQKMGGWWPNMELAKASEYNRLYWRFLKQHRAQLEDNVRLAMVLKRAESME